MPIAGPISTFQGGRDIDPLCSDGGAERMTAVVAGERGYVPGSGVRSYWTVGTVLASQDGRVGAVG